jgi:hypothetical protein
LIIIDQVAAQIDHGFEHRQIVGLPLDGMRKKDISFVYLKKGSRDFLDGVNDLSPA